jgi:chromate reductase
MAQPEVYIGGAAKLFDVNGTLINESTQTFLSAFMKEFALWIEKNSPKNS